MNKFTIIQIFVHIAVAFAFPDQGQWGKTYNMLEYAYFGAHKSLTAGATVSVSIHCEPNGPPEKSKVKIGWVLRQTSCFEEYYLESDLFSQEVLQMYYNCPSNSNGFSKVRYLISEPVELDCTSHMQLQFLNASSFLPNPLSLKAHVRPGCDNNFMHNSLDDSTDSYFRPQTAYINPQSSHDVKLTTANDTSSRTVVKQTGEPSDPAEDSNNADKFFLRRRKRDSAAAVAVKVGDSEKIKPDKPLNDVVLKNPKELTTLGGGTSGHLSGDFKASSSKYGSKVAAVDMDGVYLFVIKMESVGKESSVNVSIAVTMKADYGYLSAADYPLLWFYGFMCGLYVLYAFGWLLVSALQWRDLLRIQFWIGGVIFLGLIEKAVFYAEYQSINSTGQSVQGAVLFAEILSCLKRTLARMLVIIVSLGFGIVKPRLGPTLHRVVGVGALYFFLGTLEGCLRVLKPKNDLSKQALIAGIPLAVTDSAICWWIFSSLVQTLRTLKLRRNLVKLALYQHFTNTLIFAVLASVAFMVWSIRSHKLVACITDWNELWVDEAYWHLLFSLILLVIMILWRPTQNNQRYAFTPLLDAYDDDNDDFDSSISNDAFDGMKMRATKPASPLIPNDLKNKQDDDLKWVEENIPTSLSDVALPTLLDSDEEIMTAKFERNKME